MAIRSLLELAAALVAPPACSLCGRGTSSATLVCRQCAAALAAVRPIPFALPGARVAVAAGPYEGTLRELIVALKFAARTRLAGAAAPLLAAAIESELADCNAIVAVPPAPLRRLRRGFDPAEAIAAAIAAELSLPFVSCLRRRQGPRQVGRPRAVRLAHPPRVRAVATVPRAPVLVDDVVTTGATLTACADALRSAGAERVVAAVLARA